MPRQLLPYSAFDMIFAPLRGKRVGYVSGHGNVGDRMLDAAVEQLLSYNGISAYRFDKRAAFELPEGGLDCVLCMGGGNFGDLYPGERALRERALGLGVPVVVLPQSGLGDSEYDHPYQVVYFREKYSFGCHKSPALAPDLALCLVVEDVPAPVHGTGLFMRRGQEEVPMSHPRDLGDPAGMVEDVRGYLSLAGSYAHVVTNRLHFAIAAMLCGRRATLMPNSYHKNRGVYEQWLEGLGCDWADGPGVKLL